MPVAALRHDGVPGLDRAELLRIHPEDRVREQVGIEVPRGEGEAVAGQGQGQRHLQIPGPGRQQCRQGIDPVDRPGEIRPAAGQPGPAGLQIGGEPGPLGLRRRRSGHGDGLGLDVRARRPRPLDEAVIQDRAAQRGLEAEAGRLGQGRGHVVFVEVAVLDVLHHRIGGGGLQDGDQGIVRVEGAVPRLHPRQIGPKGLGLEGTRGGAVVRDQSEQAAPDQGGLMLAVAEPPRIGGTAGHGVVAGGGIAFEQRDDRVDDRDLHGCQVHGDRRHGTLTNCIVP